MSINSICAPLLFADGSRKTISSVFDGKYTFPETLLRTPVEYLAETNQILLMEIFFTELFFHLPRTDHDKGEFFAYCSSIYRDDSAKLKHLEDFIQRYQEKDAIQWYTNTNSFICTLVIKALNSFDFNALFKLGFYLRDLNFQ